MTRPPEQPVEDRPVEFWPTSSIRAALENGDIGVWQRIVVAIKRDPFGRTARQVEEVLHTAAPYGISRALSEVLTRARNHLEANERAEAARHVRLLMERSGLAKPEFASRIGATHDEMNAYLDGTVSPTGSLMIRMRRLSDRFAKMRATRGPRGAYDDGPGDEPNGDGPRLDETGFDETGFDETGFDETRVDEAQVNEPHSGSAYE